MSLPLKVVIVGAGIGGLATAYGLAYSKHADRFEIRILEQRDAGKVVEQVGYPIRLAPPGRQALTSLLTPLDATLIRDARAKFPLTRDGLSVIDDRGDGKRKTMFSGAFPPYDSSSMIERADLMRVLRDALQGRGVEVEYGVKVFGVQDEGEGWFALERKIKRMAARRATAAAAGGGTSAGPEKKTTEASRHGAPPRRVSLQTDKGEVEADFVVGADGMFSSIRRALYPSGSANAVHLGRVVRNYRLTSPAIWDWLKDAQGINVIVSGSSRGSDGRKLKGLKGRWGAGGQEKGKGNRWAATLIPTRHPSTESALEAGNEKGAVTGPGKVVGVVSGEVYCLLTTREGVSDTLDGLQGSFIDDLKRDPGFIHRTLTSDRARILSDPAGGDIAEALGEPDIATTDNKYCPAARSAEAKDAHAQTKTRNVSISVQSVLSSSTDASTRPLLHSAGVPGSATISTVPQTATSITNVEGEPTSLIEALRASAPRHPSSPATAAVAGAGSTRAGGAQGYALVTEEQDESENDAHTLVQDPAVPMHAKMGESSGDDTNFNPQAAPTPSVLALYTCARTYSGRPRIAIIGDAAHGMTPFAGSGASLALRDAEDLVRVLERRVGMMADLEEKGQVVRLLQEGRGGLVGNVKALFEGVRADKSQNTGEKQYEGKKGRKGRTVIVRPTDVASDHPNTGVVQRTDDGSSAAPMPLRASHVERRVSDLFDNINTTSSSASPSSSSSPTAPGLARSSAKAHTADTNAKAKAKSTNKAEKKMRKDMYMFNLRMKRSADPAILASRGSLWMAMGESALARGTRGAVFGLGRASGWARSERVNEMCGSPETV